MKHKQSKVTCNSEGGHFQLSLKEEGCDKSVPWAVTARYLLGTQSRLHREVSRPHFPGTKSGAFMWPSMMTIHLKTPC